eukprot:366228-Chlamydomonas_euryale.AAC.37
MPDIDCSRVSMSAPCNSDMPACMLRIHNLCALNFSPLLSVLNSMIPAISQRRMCRMCGPCVRQGMMIAGDGRSSTARVICPVCDRSSKHIERVAIPYVFRYLVTELAAMNIKVSLEESVIPFKGTLDVARLASPKELCPCIFARAGGHCNVLQNIGRSCIVSQPVHQMTLASGTRGICSSAFRVVWRLFYLFPDIELATTMIPSEDTCTNDVKTQIHVWQIGNVAKKALAVLASSAWFTIVSKSCNCCLIALVSASALMVSIVCSQCLVVEMCAIASSGSKVAC